jgi:hypothetical protein
MKRWAVYTVLIYAFALLFLTAPVIFVAFADWGIKSNNGSVKDIMGIYASLGYWIWLAVLLAGQFLLLLVPIDISKKRLPSRRKLKVPVIVSAFFLANLFIAGILSILFAILKDGAFNLLNYCDASAVLGLPDGSNTGGIIAVILFPLSFWIIWGIIFSNFARSDSPDALLKRATRWLLRGSILELIVAVPSHVIVRRRDDCCAPLGTFWGIATGISVMLLCFGPGVYFLFVERMTRLQPNRAEINKPDSK